MQRLLKSSHLILIAVLLLTACNLPFGESAPSSAEAARTSAAQTVEVLRTQAAASGVGLVTLPPINTPVPNTPAAPPATLTPPNTLVPTKAPTATPYPTATFVPIPCDRVDFITDVTIPDNSIISPGNTFTKTWRLKNSGSCSWNTNYKLVYVSGEQMEGAASTALPGNVNPGQTIDLSVSMKAPSSTGSHQSFWMLQNASGGKFGWGINADQAFYVIISTGSASTGTVTSGTGFAVTGVTFSIEPSSIGGIKLAACKDPGVNFYFSADITSSGAGTVTYEWRKTDNSALESGSVEFSSAGTKTVDINYQFKGDFVGANVSQLKLYINKPNHQTFTTGTFNLTCIPD
jgi:hypothetical protein